LDKKLRILILEDSPSDAEMAECELKSAGIDFISRRVTAKDEYIRVLGEFSPDLILSDYNLPAFDGLSALAVAKKQCPAVPFILVTLSMSEELAIKAFTAGVADYVLKSSLHRLAPTVRRALREVEEIRRRQEAEEERDALIRQLESHVQEQTAVLLKEIAEKERLKEVLRKSEKRYRHIVEDSTELIARLTADGAVTFANDAVCRYFGVERETILGQNYRQYLPRKDTERAVALLGSFRPDKPVSEFKQKVVLPQGEVRWLLLTIRAIYKSDGSFFEFQVMGRDITKLKEAKESLKKAYEDAEVIVRERTALLSETNKALLEEIRERRNIEKKLRKSEETYRLLFENNLAGVYRAILDPVTLKTEIIDCNDAYALILGYPSREELLGCDLASNRFSNSDWMNFLNLLVSMHKLRNYETCLSGKSRNRVWVILNVNLQKMENGSRTLIEGTMVDITPRKLAEEQMRAAHEKLRAMTAELIQVEEKERQRISIVLHDTVAQTLAAAKMRLEVLKDSVKPEGTPVLEETGDLLAQSIRQSRSIMAELSPPVLYELGFVPALEWLAELMEAQHSFPVKFEGGNGIQPLTHEAQVLLFHSTRELLLNVVKHARAKSAFVALSSDEDELRISVRDDGKGLDGRGGFHRYMTGGFGLFSIRERLRHLGGKLHIESGNGVKGTKVTMILPYSTMRLESDAPQKARRSTDSLS
jgi:PAS domain S-box-containing protein